jgi:hypothetical protein
VHTARCKPLDDTLVAVKKLHLESFGSSLVRLL